MRLILLPLAMLFAGDLRGRAAEPSSIADSLQTIKSVGREGQGNDAAAKAWRQLTENGVEALIPTLKAFQGASPTAANWLRSAVDAIAESQTPGENKLPAKELKAFLTTPSHDPAARRIAYELLVKIDQPEAEKILLGLIHDPSVELRRDAIARKLKLEPEANTKTLAELFSASRDVDQVEMLAKKLEKSDQQIAEHFGFIPRWHVIGPFDNTQNVGFATAYPPEKGVDLNATYPGKDGKTISWKTTTAKSQKNEYGLVDLNDVLGKHKLAAAYLYAVINVEKETPVELRAGSITSLKIFVNGKQAFERDEYHHGMSMDQHVGRATLKAGKNEVLVKVCQNNQTESWAQKWMLQLRICDATGGAIPFQVISPEAK